MGGGDAWEPPRLTDEEFELFRIVMERETGIVLKPSKRQLLENRLRPMLRARKRRSYAELLEGVRDPEQRQEVLAGIVDAVTTNLTRFFREPHQLEIFARDCVPALARRVKDEEARLVTVWSAGCSSGQEAWSVAMVLRELVAPELLPAFRVRATDIDRPALAQAKAGLYSRKEIEGLGPERIRRHLVERGPDRFEVVDELRPLVRFSTLNLIDPATWPLGHDQAIFCRNVIIYFARETQRKVVGALVDRLADGGYLFLGHSEGLARPEYPLEYVGPSSYRRLVRT